MKIDERKLFIQLAKKDWNFTDLANALGINTQTLITTRKRKSTRPSTIGKMAKALGCEPEDLLKEE